MSQDTEVLLQDVDQSALSMMSVADNLHVLNRSVSTHVKEPVDSMQSAQLEIIFLCASVLLDMKEIHLDNATRNQKLSSTQKRLILAIPVHVEPMHNVQKLTEELLVNVCQTTLETHTLSADQNVLPTQIVQLIEHVLT